MNTADTSLISRLLQFNIIELVVFSIILILLSIFLFGRKIKLLFFIIITTASLAGIIFSELDIFLTLIRWLCISILFFIGITSQKETINIGIIAFWGYIILGAIFLINSWNIYWQIQRTILLVMTCLGITLSLPKSLINTANFEQYTQFVAVVGSIISIPSFILLIGQISIPTRFSAIATGAPNFSIIMGALLPFIYRGITLSNKRKVCIFFFTCFLLSLFVLISTAQRTGIIAGLISIIPMTFIRVKDKPFLTLTAMGLITFVLINLMYNANFLKFNFVIDRFSSFTLSNRDLIWQETLSLILKNPLKGYGIGAAEMIFPASIHNGYLESWYNSGFFGGLLFVITQLFVVIKSIILFSKTSPKFHENISLLLGYSLGFIVSNSFESIGAGASNLNLILFQFILVSLSTIGKSSSYTRINKFAYKFF